jgi:hypothetical protein
MACRNKLRVFGFIGACVALSSVFVVLGACELVAPISVVSPDTGPRHDGSREAEAGSAPGCDCSANFCQSYGWSSSIVDGGELEANAQGSCDPLFAQIPEAGVSCVSTDHSAATAIAKSDKLIFIQEGLCGSIGLTFDMCIPQFGGCLNPTIEPSVVNLTLENSKTGTTEWSLSVNYSSAGEHLVVQRESGSPVAFGYGCRHVSVSVQGTDAGGTATLSVVEEGAKQVDAGSVSQAIGLLPAGNLYVAAGLRALPSATWKVTIQNLVVEVAKCN